MARQSFEAEHRRPLLLDPNFDGDLDSEKPAEDRPLLKCTSCLRRQPFIFVSALLLLSVLVNLGQALSAHWASGRFTALGMGIRPDESYSPACDAVEYELRKFSRARWMTPWHGPPSDAVDDAWEALYNFGVSKIPKSVRYRPRCR
ncbi:hypothetical protein FIBSPDRAFT_225486 [Athelia psychrophila]|uniref:Uncharacterized protein n=1 Tax=Athelia psychrophila TaxID=1759441 RepID=A0A166S7T7_9AGAM|nr:hypothetical protein FIBSPDRAFT_225486 [Fibularhizoctonia sp. CBS 109695]